MRRWLSLSLLSFVFLSAPALARQDDPRLKDLFADLQASHSSIEAGLIEQRIEAIWANDGNPRVDAFMQQGIDALSLRNTELALAAFNKVVELDSTFAEGYNKRATVEFLMHDFDASVADIQRTLELEPRHWGALAGLGQIYLLLGDKKAALRAFEAALKINPHLTTVSESVKELKQELGGSPT
ncbi:MAG TPA: tetratricopeptide repeat protein [Stellaceae bacterium]|nr:tetratricopeptide repeat protein [Stellaceae bacterium]